MVPYHRHLISINTPVRDSLKRLDELAADAILFLTDEENRLIGSLTDGDLRRGFIKGLGFEDHLSQFIQPNPKFIQKGHYNLKSIIELRDKYFVVFPVVGADMKVVNVVNFRHQRSYLPVDAFIMAGGKGERLRPLTDHTPKPLLKVGEKPILELNIDRLRKFGVDDIWISIKHLGEQIQDYFKDGSHKGIHIQYIEENEPLGTAGALALVDNFIHDYVLLMNSDLLTNIDLEDFFMFFEENEADFAVACIPYQVNIPYAVMETHEQKVIGLKEKPTYTHYSNAGIYLMKKEIIKEIPKGDYFNATDLMDRLINNGNKVVAYPLMGYWLDIGKHEDYKKAQEDIKHIKF